MLSSSAEAVGVGLLTFLARSRPLSSCAWQSDVGGGWQRDERPYFKGAGQTYSDGDRLSYGALGRITGAGDTSGKVEVQFPGNKGPIGCFFDTLSRTKPPPTVRAHPRAIGRHTAPAAARPPPHAPRRRARHALARSTSPPHARALRVG